MAWLEFLLPGAGSIHSHDGMHREPCHTHVEKKKCLLLLGQENQDASLACLPTTARHENS